MELREGRDPAPGEHRVEPVPGPVREHVPTGPPERRLVARPREVDDHGAEVVGEQRGVTLLAQAEPTAGAVRGRPPPPPTASGRWRRWSPLPLAPAPPRRRGVGVGLWGPAATGARAA